MAASLAHFTRSQASKLSPIPSSSLTKTENRSTSKSNNKIKTKTDKKSNCFIPFSAAHYSELKSIWRDKQQIPSLSSRRKWALGRQLDPVRVNSWFFRKKAAAKKAGLVVLSESYELPVGTPPNIQVKEDRISPELSSPRKRMRGNKSEHPYCVSRSGSPTLDGSVYGSSTSAGSSETVSLSPLPKATEIHKRRAYKHSFDIPTDLFLDPTLKAEERTASLTAVSTRTALTCPTSTHSDQFVEVEEYKTMSGSQDNPNGEGLTSAVDCLCVLCTSPLPDYTFETLIPTLTLADLALLFEPPASSTPVLSFQLPASDHPKANSDVTLIPSHAGISNADQMPTPDSTMVTELSAIPFLSRSPDLLPAVPRGLDYIADFVPFVKIHLQSSSHDTSHLATDSDGKILED